MAKKDESKVLILCDTPHEGCILKAGLVYALPATTAENLVKGGLADDAAPALKGRPAYEPEDLSEE